MDLTNKGWGSSLSKEKAWERFAKGSNEAFEHVFKNYYQSMFGYGNKLCNNPERVKDCIQELFEDIWERRGSLGHIESPNVYLFVSLRRKIIKRGKSSRESARGLEEVEDVIIRLGKEDLIIQDEIKTQKKEELQEALNQLSNRQKEVVYLHYYNGMSYGEIEQILSINRQSVRNHIYRAMETLRSRLDSEILKLVGSLILSIILFV